MATNAKKAEQRKDQFLSIIAYTVRRWYREDKGVFMYLGELFLPSFYSNRIVETRALPPSHKSPIPLSTPRSRKTSESFNYYSIHLPAVRRPSHVRTLGN